MDKVMSEQCEEQDCLACYEDEACACQCHINMRQEAKRAKREYDAGMHVPYDQARRDRYGI